jgi:hypothetical protein
MRRSRIRDPTWQSIASVVDPLVRLAMHFTPAGPIPPRLTFLAAAWIPCIKQLWPHRKMRVSEANAAIGESREESCPEPAGTPSQRAASERSTCPCANSATQIRTYKSMATCHGTAPGWLIFRGGCLGSEGDPEKVDARQGVMLRSQLRRIMNCSTMRRSSTRRTSPGSSSISAASTTRTRSGSTPRTRCTTFSGDDPPSTSCYRKRSGAQAAIVEQNYHRVSGRSGSPASGLSPP